MTFYTIQSLTEEKMRAESLIYKCFQVTLPTLPCNQLPYLQSTSVGEKSAFPRLANLLVSRHVYTSAKNLEEKDGQTRVRRLVSA